MIRTDPKHGVALLDESLDLPENLRISSGNWTEFGIWGLMVFDSQPPWFSLIECMHILFYRHQKASSLFSPPVEENGSTRHEYIKYEIPKNWNLRYLLFRDLEIDRIAGNGKPDNNIQWDEMVRCAREADESLDLAYLRDAFEDVESLNDSLRVLRTIEVGAQGQKGWTSRHLLPLGPDLLFAEIRNRTLSRSDRLFLRRTGELLYLMLGRSDPSARECLENLIRKRMLQSEHVCNRLAKLIGKGPGNGKHDGDSVVSAATGYLPFARLDVYDQLARDWMSLLKLTRMRTEDILDPLMRISTLHLIIYMLGVGRSVIERKNYDHPPFVLDLAGRSRKNPVQRIARGQYGDHLALPRRSVDAFFDQFAESQHWKKVIGTSKGEKRAGEIISDMFRVGNETGIAPQQQLDNLRDAAISKKSHSIRSAIVAHSRQVGMILARRGVGTWYAPNDAFLEALVLANVTEPLVLGEFLRSLYQRYRIVIGQEQAQQAFEGDVLSIEKLKHNEQRLEERLRVLNFIDRKSDACAFVVNPFFDSGESDDLLKEK